MIFKTFFNMLPNWIRYPLIGIGLIIGGYMAVENWVIKTAVTATKPLKVKVAEGEKRFEDYIRADEYHKASMDAKLNILIERE